MFKLHVLFTFITIILTSTNANRYLVITENLDNAEKIASTSATVALGSNLTLTCKCSSSDNEDLLHDEVWMKINSNKYAPKRLWSDLKLETNEERFKIEFKPVGLYDEGTYVCSSKNYRLYKKLKLIVRKKFKSRTKRSQYNLGISKNETPTLPSIYYPESIRDIFDGYKKTEDSYRPITFVDNYKNYDFGALSNSNDNKVPDLDIPDSVKETLDRIKKIKEQISYSGTNDHKYDFHVPIIPPLNFTFPDNEIFNVPKKNKDPYWADSNSNDKKYEANFHSDHDWNRNFNQKPSLDLDFEKLDEIYRVEDNKNNDMDNYPVDVGHSKSNYNIFYFLGILISFVLILFIILVARRSRNQQRNQRRVPTTEPPCSHHVCAQHRANDPTVGCYLASINSSHRRPENITTVRTDGGITVTTNLISSNTDASAGADIGFNSFYTSANLQNRTGEPGGINDIFNRPGIVELDSSDSEENVDLPPTYSSSVKKGKLCPSAPRCDDLPPSYNEAVKVDSDAPSAPPPSSC